MAGVESEICKEAKVETVISSEVFVAWEGSRALPIIDTWMETRDSNIERQKRL